jgi:hypothetical protein
MNNNRGNNIVYYEDRIIVTIQYSELPEKKYLQRINRVYFYLKNKVIYSYAQSEPNKGDYSLSVNSNAFQLIFTNFPDVPDCIGYSFFGGYVYLYLDLTEKNKIRIEHIDCGFY